MSPEWAAHKHELLNNTNHNTCRQISSSSLSARPGLKPCSHLPGLLWLTFNQASCNPRSSGSQGTAPGHRAVGDKQCMLDTPSSFPDPRARARQVKVCSHPSFLWRCRKRWGRASPGLGGMSIAGCSGMGWPCQEPLRSCFSALFGQVLQPESSSGDWTAPSTCLSEQLNCSGNASLIPAGWTATGIEAEYQCCELSN